MISTPLLSLVAFLFYVYPGTSKIVEQLPESAAEGFAEGMLPTHTVHLPLEGTVDSTSTSTAPSLPTHDENKIEDLEEELEELKEEQQEQIEEQKEDEEEKQEEDVELPTYERFYEMERNYPQHDKSLPYPEGENGRFVWVSNQHWGEQFSVSSASIG